MSLLYQKTEQFVITTFTKANNPNEIIHAQRTVHWIQQLQPEADETLLIAGVMHDIERAFFGDWKQGSTDQAQLRKHQELSAQEAEKFLRSQQIDEILIMRVKQLIAHHETGGDADQNVLCDADCLSYLEEKALRLAKTYQTRGKTKADVEKTLTHVMNRVTSARAKQLAQPLYDTVMKILNTNSATIPTLSIYGNIVDIKKDKFRIRVSGYCLIIHENKILLVNTKSTGKWFFPGGEVEIGEPIEDAMKREVLEETGIKVKVEKFLDFREVFFYYDPLDEAFQNYALYFKCTPITFTVSDKQNVVGDESNQPTWIDIASLKKNDFQPGAYEILKLL